MVCIKLNYSLLEEVTAGPAKVHHSVMASCCQKPGIQGSDVDLSLPTPSPLVVILGNPDWKPSRSLPQSLKQGGLTATSRHYPKNNPERGHSWVMQIFRKGPGQMRPLSPIFHTMHYLKHPFWQSCTVLGFSLSALKSIPPNKNCLNPMQHLCWIHHTTL